jgi:hypothetical protein
VIGARVRRPEPPLVSCGRCGSDFRAAYTGGRCPICDWAPEAAVPGGARRRLGDLAAERWPVLLFAVAIAGNIAIAVVVARAVSGR